MAKTKQSATSIKRQKVRAKSFWRLLGSGSLNLVYVYKKTRRIILNAFSPENFILIDGKVQCVDVDMTLSRSSADSKLYFRDNRKKKAFDNYWNNNRHKYPRTITIIRNLLYSEEHLTANEILDCHINYEVIFALSYHRKNNIPINQGILNDLLDANTVLLDESNEKLATI
jgi:hypothetical protein